MQTIHNLAEAKETVEALREFLNRFEQTLGALGSLTGQALPPSVELRKGPPPRPINTGTAPLPQSMQDRVYEVLRSGAAPMTASQMVARYQEFGWPVPDRKALYRQLLSCAYYLATKRKTLANDNGRYSIAPQQGEGN